MQGSEAERCGAVPASTVTHFSWMGAGKRRMSMCYTC